MKILVITKISMNKTVCTAPIDENDFIFLIENPGLFYEKVWSDAILGNFVDTNERDDYEIKIFENGKLISKNFKASVISFEDYRNNKKIIHS